MPEELEKTRELLTINSNSNASKYDRGRVSVSRVDPIRYCVKKDEKVVLLNVHGETSYGSVRKRLTF
jgi:hypothetical protein